jgi:hypothetical protein
MMMVVTRKELEWNMTLKINFNLKSNKPYYSKV